MQSYTFSKIQFLSIIALCILQKKRWGFKSVYLNYGFKLYKYFAITGQKSMSDLQFEKTISAPASVRT